MSWIKTVVRKIPPLLQIVRWMDARLYQRYLPVYQSLNCPTAAAANPVQVAPVSNLPPTTQNFQAEIQPEPQEQSLPVEENMYLRFSPAGHYYSTIPNQPELVVEKERIFSTEYRPIPGIQIPDAAMLDLLERFAAFYSEFPFTAPEKTGFRYSLPNGVYDWGEAIILYSLMRTFHPHRIIEVGSGFSSALMLDINDHFMSNSLQFTFVDPYTERLQSLVTQKDAENVTILPKRLQDVDFKMFQALESNDIAFFDSTHVSKCDSDVNHIFFDVLPQLKSGVIIHFHDVFYPFEYPERWLLEVGAAWNEDYLLRAFLEYNDSFEILFFNDYMNRFHKSAVQKAFGATNQWLGSSMWLRKK